MKKQYFYFALLALAAFFAFLSACGEGNPVNLDDDAAAWGKIGLAIDEFVEHNTVTGGYTGSIMKCQEAGTISVNGTEVTCPDISLPSSSSIPLPSSSSEEPVGPGESSSAGSNPSPSSTGGNTSSAGGNSSSSAGVSSSTTGQSSSSTGVSSSSVAPSSSSRPSSSSVAPSSSSRPSSSSVAPSSSSSAPPSPPSSSSTPPSGGNTLELEPDPKSLTNGSSYTLNITKCTGNNTYFYLICGWNNTSTGCSIKIGSTSYNGSHNNSPGCKFTPLPAANSVVEALSGTVSVKCGDQYSGSTCN